MFEQLKPIPADPLLGLIAAYRNDTNRQKIDLGVGVYRDEHGHTPILASVKTAERLRSQQEDSKTYLGPPGVVGFNRAMTALLFGADSATVAAGRVCTVHTPGGTGGLRVAAEFIRRACTNAKVWLSQPTWDNHTALFPAAGLTIASYPYFDPATSSLSFAAMMDALANAGPGDVVLFHACCHNPCGVDLEPDHWQALAKLAQERGFLPLIDIAYQGFGTSLDADALGVRTFADALPELVVTSSCSKNFGLYRERAGAISIVCQTDRNARAAETVIHSVTRGLYSMPPAHGPALVDIILHSEELRAQWLQELAVMRDRLNGLRTLVVDRLRATDINRDFSFIERQRGMFSFLGISLAQVRRMREEFSIYLADSTRINIAGLSHTNVDYFVESLRQAIRAP